jgi:hypothetical protein
MGEADTNNIRSHLTGDIIASIVKLIWLVKFQENCLDYKNQLKIFRRNGEFFLTENLAACMNSKDMGTKKR